MPLLHCSFDACLHLECNVFLFCFCKVFLMETDSSTSAGWLAGSFHLALAGVPFVMLCVPIRFQLCSYLQYHVREGQAHLLLLWLWSTQLLQPWYVENITELMSNIYWYTYVMFLWLNYPNFLFMCIWSTTGSAITYSSYSFPDKWVNSTFHKYYVPIAVVNSVISTALACCSR